MSRGLASFALLFAVGFASSAPAQTVNETDHSQQFTAGSNGYQSNVPSTSVNLLNALSGSGVTFSANVAAPTGDENTNASWSVLTDGSFGTVPNSGGGGPGEAGVNNGPGNAGVQLTYTFSSGYNINAVDIFSGWGDNGRMQPRLTVQYSTIFNPTTFVNLQTINYNPGGVNSAWVDLAVSSLTNVKAIRFFFSNNQENGKSGYTELAVSGTPTNAPLTWTGGGGSGGNGSWDTTGSTSNWVTTSGGSPAVYSDGSAVTFSDTGANTNITVQGGGVQPGGVSFINSSSKTYTFGGGAIGGTGDVNITGGGQVNFNAANTFSGTTNITSGSLRVGNSGALQNTTVNINAANGLTFASGLGSANFGALAGSANFALSDGSNGVNLTAGSNGGSTTYSGVLSGPGNFTKAGGGTLTLTGANTYGGSTTVSGGVLRVGAISNGSVNNSGFTTGTTPGGFTYNPNGASWTFLSKSGVAANNSAFSVANSPSGYAAFIQSNGGDGQISQSVSFPSAGLYSLNFLSEARVGYGNGNPITVSFDGVNIPGLTNILPASNSSFGAMAGAIYVPAAGSYPITFTSRGVGGNDVTTFVTNVTVGASSSLPSGSSLNTLNVAGSASLDLAGSATVVPALTGTGTITNSVTGSAAIGVAPTGFSSFGGVIQNGSSTALTSLYINGGGTQTLTGASTYTGATLVAGGTLQLASTASLGNTAVTVLPFAVLAPNPVSGGTVALGGSLSVQGSGKIDMSGDSQTGTFRVGSLSLSGGSILNVDVGTSGLNTVVDTLASVGAATDSGTTTINVSGFGNSNLSNGLYPIITAASGLQSGSFILGNSTVNVHGINYSLSLVSSATQELLRVTAPAINGSWIQSGLAPPNPNYSWGVAGNWSGAVPGLQPASGDTATFASGNTGQQNIDLDVDRYLGVITFNNTSGGAYTINGTSHTLNLDGGGAGALVVNTTGTNVFSGKVNLTDSSIVNAAGGTSVAFNGVVSGAGKSLTVNPGGSGIVVLNGANTFSGGLTVAGGMLQVPTINGASTDGPLGHNTSVTLGAVGGSIGAIQYTGVGNVSSDMPISLAGGGGGDIAVNDGGSTVTLSGAITTSGIGVGSLSIDGPGAVRLTSSGNSFAGGLNLNGGTLRDANSAAGTIGSGLVAFGNSNTPTLDLNGNSPTVAQLSGAGTNGTVTNTGGSLSTLTVNGAGSSTYNGAINSGSGNIALVVTGGGTQVLGGTSTFSGGLAVQNGTVRVTSNGGIGSANAVTLGSGSSGGSLVLGSGSTPANVSIASLGTSGSGTNRVVGGANSTSTLTVTAPGTFTVPAGFFGGSGANQNNLAVSLGSGTITSSTPQTYSGGTTLGAGAVLNLAPRLSTISPVGSGAVSLAGGTLNLQGVYAAGNGLTANLFDYGAANGGNNPNQSHYNDYNAFTTYWNSIAPTVSVPTPTGGKTNLDYSNNNYGGPNPMFNQAGATNAQYGFSVSQNLEARLTGYIYINNAGTYAFSTTSDDGSMVFIDGQTVVNNNNYQGATKRNGTIPLTAGLHQIDVGFFQGVGGEGLLVTYDGPDTGVTSPTAGNTTIANNVLFLSNSPPAIAATQTLNNALSVTSSSTLNVSGSLSATVGAVSIGSAALNVTSSDSTATPYSLTTGNVTLAGNATFNVANSTGGGPGTLNLAGTVTDGGSGYSISKSGPGTLVFSSALNSYSGGTNVGAGTVVAQQPGVLGSGAVSLANGATLQLVASPGLSINGFQSGAGWAAPNVASGGFTPAFGSNSLQITDAASGGSSTSVFYNTQQTVTTGSAGFVASFTYQMTKQSPTQYADGMTFILQRDSRGVTATGGGGGSLGYAQGDNAPAAITPSAEFTLNIYHGHTIGTNFIGSSTNNGTFLGTGSVDFSSGDPINVTLSYNPLTQTVTETDTDTVTTATFVRNYTGLDLASILGGSSAYVGFTGGTGGENATQLISNFGYTAPDGASSYANALNIAGAATATVDVVPTASNSSSAMGAFTVGAGGDATLNVTANSAADNAPFGLTLGATTLNSNLTINVNNNGSGAGTVTLGAVAGAGKGLTLSGSGTVRLNAANSYSGNTNILAGTLRLADGSTNNIASSPVVTIHDGATLDVTGLSSGTITLAGSQTLAGVGAAPSVHGSVVAASGSRLTGGSGTEVSIDGSSGLTLNTGSTVSVALAGTPGGAGVNPMFVLSGGSLTLNSSSTLELTGSPQAGTYDLFSFPTGSGPSSGLSISNLTGNSSLNYSLQYLAHEIDLVVTNSGVSAAWNFNGDGAFSASAKWNPVGVPSGPTLTATFGDGSLSVPIGGTPNAIHVTIDQAVTDGHLQFNNSHGVTYSLDSDGTHSISLNNSGATATIDASANAAIHANLVLADSQGTTINVVGINTALGISGGITGAGGVNGLVKTGTGTLTIDGAGSYSGATTVNAGTLRTTLTGSIGSGALIVNNSGSTAEFGNNMGSQTVSSLSGTGGTVRVDGGASLAINQAATTSFSGGVTLSTGGASLTKSGSGHLTVSGATDIKDNASITVSADMSGTNKLTLSGASTSIGSGVIATIGAGATLELAGTGSNLGAATVADRTHVIDSGTLVASSTTAAQIVGGIDGGSTSTPGAGSVSVANNASLQADHVLVGSISLGSGAVLTLAASDASGMPTSVLGSTSSIGLSHLLASRSLLASSHSSLATGSSGNSGSVSSLGSGSLGGTAAVPEPSTVALVAIAAVCGVGLGLRRRGR